MFNEQTFGNAGLIIICNGGDRLCKDFTENIIEQFTEVDFENKCTNDPTLKPSVTIVHMYCYVPRNYVKDTISELVVLIDGDERNITEFRGTNTSSRIVVSAVTDIKKNINLLLERYVCAVLREMIDMVITVDGTEQTLAPNETKRRLRTSNGSNSTYSSVTVSNSNSTWRQNIDNKLREKRKVDDYLSGSLRSGKRFRQFRNDEEERKKLDIFLLDVMAMFSRSDVPDTEWPEIQYQKHCFLNRRIVENLHKTDPNIVGCGYQHHILEIFINREEDHLLDSAISKILKTNKICFYHFNYGPFKYTQMCNLKGGSRLLSNNKKATLGGFAKDNTEVYALVSRHFVEQVGNEIYYERANGEFVGMNVETLPSEGGLDIAALKVLNMSNIQDTRFRDSRGMFVHSILFEFDHDHAERIQHLLQSEKVFAWTANSSVGPCIGRIKIPVFTRPNYQDNYVIIENENGEYDDQGRVGPPVAHSFGAKGDSGSIVCFDDKDGNGVHVVSMFMGKLDSQDVVGFITIPLQQGLQQVNTSLNRNLMLC